MITPFDFVMICVAVFALFWIGVMLWADKHPVRQTVEQEDEECRGVVRSLPQTYPMLTLFEDEGADDPISSLVGRMEDDRRVGSI